MENAGELRPLFTTTGGVLKGMTNMLGSLVDEAKLHLTPTYLSFKVVDPAHVAMLDAVYPNSGDLMATTIKEGEVDIGVSVDKLKWLYGQLGKNQKVALFEAGGKVVAQWEDDDGSKNSCRFDAIDVMGMSDPKMPVLSFDMVLTMPVKLLRAAVKRFQAGSNFMEIVALQTGKGINLNNGVTDDGTYVETDLPVADWKTLNNPVRVRFSLDYLDNVLRSIAEDDVVMEGKTDYPMRITTVPYEGAQAIFMLAPRIEDA